MVCCDKGRKLTEMPTQSAASNKHHVYMVSGNESYLEELSNVISPYYHARAFADTSELIDELFSGLPKTLIIDATQSGTSALRFISAVRVNFDSKQLPIIFTVMGAQESWITEANKVTGLKCLEKPYQTSQLLSTISDQINAHTESQWDEIEPVQQQALKKTLSFFNSIAGKIMSGEAVEYSELTDSCEPPVEAVSNKNYQDILRSIREHDNYTYVHSMRAATFLCAFGQSIGIPDSDLLTLSTGGLMLDVGKNYIPYELLNKSTPLEAHEYEVIKEHVLYGASFLNQMDDIPKGVSIIAEQHHEKIDGTGYPHNLKGSQLNNLARMAAIVDIFCALTDRRTYKQALSPQKALATMVGMEGHLDRRLLMSFGEMLLADHP